MAEIARFDYRGASPDRSCLRHEAQHAGLVGLSDREAEGEGEGRRGGGAEERAALHQDEPRVLLLDTSV